MQYPLLHRSTQITMLRRQIKRKSKEVRRQKRRARRRLELMRRIREQLLRRVQNSIESREMEAEQERRERARQSLGALLRMYRRWLQSWSRTLRQQRRQISQQEQLELQLQQRLYLLRKQLKKRRRPQHMVDQCIKRLARAVRKWQKSSEVHPLLKGHDNIWEMEAVEVREYLTHLHGKPLKLGKTKLRRAVGDIEDFDIPDFKVTYNARRKTRRRRKFPADEKIQDFSQFWDAEVLQKKPKPYPSHATLSHKSDTDCSFNPDHLRHKRSLAHRKLYSLPPMVTFKSSLNVFQSKQSLRKSYPRFKEKRSHPSKKPSLDALQRLLNQLQSINAEDPGRGSGKSWRGRHHKRKINRATSADTLVGAKATILQKKVIRLRKKRRPQKISSMEARLEEFREKFHADHRKPKHSSSATSGVGHGWKKKRKISYGPPHETIVQSGDFDSDITDLEREYHHKQRKTKGSIESEEKPSSSPTVSDTGTEYMARRLRKLKRRQYVETSPSVLSRDTQLSVASFSESVKEIILSDDPRGSLRRSFRDRKPRGSLKRRPVKGRLSLSIGRKGQAIIAKPSTNIPILLRGSDDDAGSSESYRIGQQIGNRIGDGIRGQIGYKPRTRAPVDPSRVPVIDMVTHMAKSQAKQVTKVSSKEALRESLKNSEFPQEFMDLDKWERDNTRETLDSIPPLELELAEQSRFRVEDMSTDYKFRRLQKFLKDIIENNTIMDYVADTNELMKVVGKHEMWKDLQDLYNDLAARGVSQEDSKKILGTKYMEYLKSILNDLNLAKKALPRLIPPRDSENKVIAIPKKDHSHLKVDHLLTKRTLKKSKSVAQHQPQPEDSDSYSQGLGTPHRRHQVMDDLMYKKIIEQELLAARLVREERRRRLLAYPSFSRRFSSHSTYSNRSNWDVAPSEEENIREAETRYSAKNLQTILNDHTLMFKVRNPPPNRFSDILHSRHKGSPVEKPLKIKQTRKKLKPQTTYAVRDTTKRQRRQLRPTEELFYSPRKTCRQQKISDFGEPSECLGCVCLKEPCNSNYYEKCPRCGVPVEVPQPPSTTLLTWESSQDLLSQGSIEACAKNEWLRNTTEDICVRCGYVHPKTKYCPQLPVCPLMTKPLQQIKRALVDQVEMPEWPAFSPAGILKKPTQRFRVVDP
ncbi:hypothetical protein KR026_001511 [Drosophila bipectinata]|nr:hypothetical protein KR026_001511 [Drosophila bipectinata]